MRYLPQSRACYTSAGLTLRAYAECVHSIPDKVLAYAEYLRSTPDEVHAYAEHMLWSEGRPLRQEPLEGRRRAN